MRERVREREREREREGQRDGGKERESNSLIKEKVERERDYMPLKASIWIRNAEYIYILSREYCTNNRIIIII